ncbi:hypothetical protein DSM3645_13705 [Blastopirellula marina DSM 3645]|uniref:Uncharacterized protein n=1 Tax=Blastopirellula marina DSM 3645 TaxID=314230 RepID=A3ZWP9_9BACT|nr:hypothetical protein DSM3645_13705 [Blastopirellula marina DSM 3645]
MIESRRRGTDGPSQLPVASIRLFETSNCSPYLAPKEQFTTEDGRYHLRSHGDGNQEESCTEEGRQKGRQEVTEKSARQKGRQESGEEVAQEGSGQKGRQKVAEEGRHEKGRQKVAEESRQKEGESSGYPGDP